MISIITRYTKRPMGVHAFSLRRIPDDCEIATMVLSALAYKENVGPIMLAADIQALTFCTWTGIADLYDHVERVEVDSRINTKKFWAAIKIYALGMVEAPCISVDLDAMILRRPYPWYDVVALHTEPIEWEAYSWHNMWDDLWSRLKNGSRRVAPLNTAVAAFYDNDLLREYVSTAKALMINGTKRPISKASQISIGESGSEVPVTEMVFAEQYALAVVAETMKKRVGTITTLCEKLNHPKRVNTAMHLWNSKAFYRKHGRANDLYMTWAMDQIWSLVRGTKREPLFQAIAHKCDLPTIRVVDGNTGVVRWSRYGEWFGPGEEVERL
jgi:hypothetical protein